MEKGYTTSDEHTIVYEWKIDRIDHYLDEFDKSTVFTLISPTFSTGAKIDDKWHISLNICNHFSVTRNRIHKYDPKMTFSLCSLNYAKTNIKCSSYFLNNESKLLDMGRTMRYLLSKDETVYIKTMEWDFMTRKAEYFRNNTLTFYLNLTVYDTPVSISTELELNIPKRQMSHDYTELYNTKMGSDVIINVRNKEFRAHKIILMARSPVLAAMFSHDMIEKKENKISIPDITPEIFEKVLKYIYTDEVNDLNLYAERLLEAADKYQIQSLKDICQESLSKTLTVDNALKIMTLADRHSAKHLLEFTNKFMTSNINKIIETQYFKEFKKSNPSAALAILEKFMICNKED